MNNSATEELAAYSEQERFHRAVLRAVMHIRGMWDESRRIGKAGSDTRLLGSLIIPDRYTIVGRSHACIDSIRSEHVVPRLLILRHVHEMLGTPGTSDDQIAEFIKKNLKIVLISPDQAGHLDTRRGMNLRQRMPERWTFGDDPFARLTAAGIEWRKATSWPWTGEVEASEAITLGEYQDA